MPIFISDLTPGNELLCWMRLGLALKKARGVNGTIFRFVPTKPGRAGPSDLTRFTGWVIANDPDMRTITLQVTSNDSHKIAINRESTVADIAYMAFQRVQIFSTTTFEPKEESITRPTGKALGTAFKAYRTVENVRLL